jgi:peptidyl-prolyl cis-trans isomerase D
MLRGIHKASSSVIGKSLMAIVMGGLIVSFAIWGIGDIFRGFGRNSVAKVGGTEISIEQFRQFYTDRLQQVSRQAGRPITPDQARALGLDRQLTGQLIAETTLDEKVHQWRLSLADADIAKLITSDPNFRGPNGEFDRQRFELVIRNAGFSEARYVEEQREVLLRRQIAQSIGGQLHVPTTMLAAINQYQNETRSIEFVALGAAQAGDIAQPTTQQLTQYFNDRKFLFRAPEYRKIAMLALTPAELAKPDAVTDAETKIYYDQHAASFGTPEKRDLRQMVFQTPQEAAAAREKITKGATFDDIAKERDLKASDTNVGMVTKSELIDPAVADAAFALKPGEVSAPVKGQFGTVLLLVTKIEPGTHQGYEQVAPQIKREIAESHARSQIGDLRDKIEDERAAGATLAETAKKLGLKSVTVDAVDRTGHAPDGKPVTDLPKQPDLLAAAFASDVGVDNDALQTPGGGFIWYDVTGITPPRDRPLEEVKAEVEKHWREDEIAKILQAKAEDMLGKLKAGTPLAQLASKAGLKPDSTWGVQRGKPTPQVPARLLEAVFKTEKGAAGVAQGNTPDTRIVFRVADVTDPKLDLASPDMKKIEAAMQNSYADDIVGQYIARLETEFGVTINQEALNQVIGGGTPDTNGQ